MQKYEIEQLMELLKGWKEQPDYSKITSILKRIQGTKMFKLDTVQNYYQNIVNFHKQVVKSQNIPQQWYSTIESIKRKLKKLEEEKKKQKNKKPIIQKKSSQIQYPPILFENKSESDKNLLQCLYKSFMQNFQPKELTPKVIPFIHQIYQFLKEQFLNRKNEQNKRVDAICLNLIRKSVAISKIQMLEGKKSAKDVSLNLQSVFIDEAERQRQLKAMKQKLKQVDTQFYKNMTRNVNKDASQQCRYCHKKAAYCSDQKQIRASDEPMTRFMVCNNCGKNWRD